MFNKKSLEKLPIIYCLGYPFKVPNDIHNNSDSIFDLIKNNVDALKHSEFHLALNLIEQLRSKGLLRTIINTTEQLLDF